MIESLSEHRKALKEIEYLDAWLARLDQNYPVGERGLTKAGIHKMLSRIHEELALFEGSQWLKRSDVADSCDKASDSRHSSEGCAMNLSCEIPMESGAVDQNTLLSRLPRLEFEIVRQLHSCGISCFERNLTDGEWTREIIRSLRDQAERECHLQFPNDYPPGWANGGEWMFDAVWCNAHRDPVNGFDWRTADRLVLVCECEWISKEFEFLTDFMKLRFASADLRLFIYPNDNVRVEDAERPLQHPVDLCQRRFGAGPTCSQGSRFIAFGFPRAIGGSCRIDAWNFG